MTNLYRDVDGKWKPAEELGLQDGTYFEKYITGYECYIVKNGKIVSSNFSKYFIIALVKAKVESWKNDIRSQIGKV